MIKKLDSMLLKGFLPPFLVSFMIALFVLVMQTLWLYIDEILGKGVGIFVIVEFLSYLSVSLFPLALPIGVLLAGVFLFGNLAERYELSSIKTAGIPLIRSMVPLIILAAGIALFSWFCSDKVIPVANLKFISRLSDIRKQKPALALAEAVFNSDFYGYVIRIGKKSFNGRDIKNVLIYDQSKLDQRGAMTVISANTGQMYTTDDGKYFIMDLYDGEVYQNPGNEHSNSKSPFIRTKFSSYQKIFNLGEFELNRSDEDIFRSNQRMKNTTQLQADVDSLSRVIAKDFSPVIDDMQRNYFNLKPKLDTNTHITKLENSTQAPRKQFIEAFENKQIDTLSKFSLSYILNGQVASDIALRAKSRFKSNMDEAGSHEKSVNQLKTRRAKHAYELYTKYSFALACFIFIFIGAPLGAIIRKGGYGYPLVISVSVFVFFILSTTFCKKLSDSLTVEAHIAAFIPCMIMLPFGLYLSYAAMTDSKVLDFERISQLFKRKSRQPILALE